MGLAEVVVPRQEDEPEARLLRITAVAIGVGIVGGFVAEALLRLIALITNLAFFHRLSVEMVAPASAEPGLWVLVIPVAGALIIGVMARWGTPAIRGHGIPEVMERVLYGESRIPFRMLLLKPLSAAIAIGTGGPFGAEGPIIATGGALGSAVGQGLHITSDERKTLLAAGAAAGMAATFGTPVAAVLLAIELLLFEYRPRSIIPVALASAAATGVRMALHGPDPMFAMPTLAQPSGAALASYVVIGALIGVASVAATRAIYLIEDGFERVPLHWMWWPAIGAVVVGAVGWIEPRTLGVGYEWIEAILAGDIAGAALITFVGLKFVSWSIYLGSGTSGGTLAPLFIIGGGLGALLGAWTDAWLPQLGVEPPIAALLGMAAIFAGASHALLASVVFAFETTRQPLGLLPLLAGCSAAYLVSITLMRHSIMTEKLARRGTIVRTEYALDFLDRITVGEVASRNPVTLSAERALGEVRGWLAGGAGGATHQGFPVVDSTNTLIGVVTRRDLLGEESEDLTVRDVIRRPPVVVFENSTLRDAADHMVLQGIGRLVVVEREEPTRVRGVVTRSDLLAAHALRLRARDHRVRGVDRQGAGNFTST